MNFVSFSQDIPLRLSPDLRLFYDSDTTRQNPGPAIEFLSFHIHGDQRLLGSSYNYAPLGQRDYRCVVLHFFRCYVAKNVDHSPLIGACT